MSALENQREIYIMFSLLGEGVTTSASALTDDMNEEVTEDMASVPNDLEELCSLDGMKVNGVSQLLKNT